MASASSPTPTAEPPAPSSTPRSTDWRACSHRGAVAADANTADGSGVLLPIPPAIFGEGNGVAMLFVRGDDPREAVEAAAAAEGSAVVEWRDAAHRRPSARRPGPGRRARSIAPGGRSPPSATARTTSAPPTGCAAASTPTTDRRLRRRRARSAPIVYKGLVAADALAGFYPDLADERFATPFAVFHQRFSTNTLPTWERAQPFRMLCHNGEINALAGQREPHAGPRPCSAPRPPASARRSCSTRVLDDDDSDSGKLDAAIELLVRGGRDIRHAVAMLVPEAWEGEPRPRPRGARLLPLPRLPDGAVGRPGRPHLHRRRSASGAALDRNGLRPLRYAVCDDGLVACCSEAGAVDVAGHGQVTPRPARPRPDALRRPDAAASLLDAGVQAAAGGRRALRPVGRRRPAPVRRAASRRRRRRRRRARARARPPTATPRRSWRMVLKPMATDAKEPTFSMGDDSPLPPLAGRPRPVHHYLRQRFAQVTNPPIDHLRERLVMCLRTLLGPRQPILTERPEAARLLELRVVLPLPVDRRRISPTPSARSPAAPPRRHLRRRRRPRRPARRASHRSGDEAETRGRRAASASSSSTTAASRADRAPVPALLATGAVHHRLIAARLRSRASLDRRQTDDARDVHYVACLLGYGADADLPPAGARDRRRPRPSATRTRRLTASPEAAGPAARRRSRTAC